MSFRTAAAAVFALLSCTLVDAATAGCTNCATWNKPHAPLRIYGNTYFVGVNGLSAILITSDQGHVLIDGALPESAPQIAANIAKLGFRIEDVKLILNSHAHFDHAGGIAELQRRSKATVAASAWSAKVLEAGHSGPSDPQAGILLPYPAAQHVKVVKDGEVLKVGDLALTAHFTPGHTPGGTTWTWQSCEKSRCLDMVYADSINAVSDDDFRYSGSPRYPNARQDMWNSFERLAALRCDILLTPHPDISDMWGREAKRDSGVADAFIDNKACVHLAETLSKKFHDRLDSEAKTKSAAK